MEESALEAAREGSDAAAEAAHLARNAVDCLPSGALAAKLAKGRPLRVKLGLDPTAPDIHLGHTVVLTKLREFQDAGHTVVLIVGDYTARVGDPSGRSATRPCSRARRSTQRGDLRAPGRQGAAHRRAARGPPQRRVAGHDDGAALPARAPSHRGPAARARRLRAALRAASEPISLLELLYPVLQGYDSVCIDADVELGGTDQTFNLLMGRSLQPALRAGAAGRADHAAADRARRRAEDVQVAGQPHRRHRRARRRCTGARCASRTSRSRRGLAPARRASRRRRSARATRSAPSRARSWRASTAEAAAEAEAAFDRLFIAHELPEEIEEAVVDAGGGSVHLPAVIAEAFGRLTQRRAARDRPGRREARRGAGPPDIRISRPRRWTAGCCRSASASSAGCGSQRL